MIHVLLYIPAHDPHQRKWMLSLWAYCMRRRYKPEAVVSEWCDVRRLMLEGVASKVVVAVREHADWLEVVSEEPDGPQSERQRRPHRTGSAKP